MFTGISLKKWLDKSLISWKDIYIYTLVYLLVQMNLFFECLELGVYRKLICSMFSRYVSMRTEILWICDLLVSWLGMYTFGKQSYP